jgi:hypothetical protein
VGGQPLCDHHCERARRMKLQAQRIVLWSTAWLATAGLGLGDGLRRVSAFLMCRLTLNGNSVELRCRDEVVLV